MTVETKTTIPTHTARLGAGPVARVLMTGIRGYQTGISPVLHVFGPVGCGCRFSPTCSQYAMEALAIHGAFRGTILATRRVLRCHPWGPSGVDPVPHHPLSTN